jgi:uncharacterized membrane protein
VKFSDMPKLPLVLAAVMVAAGTVLYSALPARIPMHWGLSGTINGWAEKSPGSVFLAPLLLLVLYVVMWLAPYLDPRKDNLVRAKKPYALTIDVLALVMTTVFIAQLAAASHPDLPVTSLVTLALGVTFVVVGRAITTVGPNHVMGMRYRATLADDIVWEKTNRLGGRLFMGAGVIVMLGALLPPAVGALLIVVPTLAIVPVTYAYAQRLYRERHPIGEPPPPPAADDAAPPLREVRVEGPHLRITCPHCGADNVPGARECVCCGKPL